MGVSTVDALGGPAGWSGFLLSFASHEGGVKSNSQVKPPSFLSLSSGLAIRANAAAPGAWSDTLIWAGACQAPEMKSAANMREVWWLVADVSVSSMN